ncbi:hypothetical protein CEQ22_015785 [Parabacteroides distasonis]|nr:hypothetical protein CEQ22_015785 [Parabacteroides distasonis]
MNVRGILFLLGVPVGRSGFTLQSLTQFWVSALSFCYRDLSAWWETRPDQPDTQYHFVITG